jgi:hypothetical protein
MEISLTTPALLFPTISLLILAYTNRFVAIGSRIRNLHGLYQQEKSDHLLQQINILRIRIRLIRDLQVVGISCLFFSVLSMFLIFENLIWWAKYSFATSLLLLLVAFSLSGWEIILSTRALNIQLRDIAERELDIFNRNSK